MAPLLSGLLLFSAVVATEAQPQPNTAVVYELACDDMGFDSSEECVSWCAHFDQEDTAGTCETDRGTARIGFFQNRTARAFLRWYADIDVVKVGPASQS